MKNIFWTKLRNGNLIMLRMKKFFYTILIALITVSCNENDEPLGNTDTPLVIPKTFYALAPVPDTRTRAVADCQPESWDNEERLNTRTYAVVDSADASEYFQYWSAGDAISLFFTDYNLKYKLQSYKDGDLDVGIFELEGEATKGTELTTGYYYSVYPYKEDTYIIDYGNSAEITYTFPEKQHYKEDSYANGENSMVAIEPMQATDSILYFQNFCSYLQLRLATDEGITKSVKKISLTANSQSDGIAGLGMVEVVDETTEPVVYMDFSATNRIILDCGSGIELSQDDKSPSKFWFVLPGDFTFTEGFYVTVIFDDNTYFTKSTSKEIGIARSHIKPMATFKPETFIEPTSAIRYKYNDTSVSEPYPLEDTFYGKDGTLLDVVDNVYDEETGEWIVLLSGTLKTIGGNSFQDTSNDLEYIKIDTDTTPVIISDFAFYNCTADFIEINNDVEEIGESAFTGSIIKDLNIFGDVTTINNSAGTGSSIENINITGHVEIIDEQAFAACSDLKTLNVGSIETIGYRAFYMCDNLTEANIPGVKYLGSGAFRSCTSLETITLESVIIIDDNAFMDCSGLTSVVISENCTMIGEGAFCNATSLKTVYCHAVNPPFIKTDNGDKSYVFDNTHKSLVIYIPTGSLKVYTNRNYFKGHKYDDPKVKAEVNWWYQDYRGKLKETEF